MGQRRVELIPAPNFRDYWFLILPGIETIEPLNGGDWQQIDLYNALDSSRALLFLASDDGEYAGFVIAKPEENRVLHVWLVYSEIQDLLTAGWDSFKAHALAMGAEKLTFSSPREGLLRMHKKLGATLDMAYYSLDLR